MKPQSSSYSADYDPAADNYSMSQITELTGARAAEPADERFRRRGPTGPGANDHAASQAR